jgi:hypothetical protein
MLLIALAFALAAPTPNLDTFKGCGPTGTANSPCGKALDRLKNRYKPATGVNPKITLAAILAPGDDMKRWSTSDAVEITGYVASVEPGGFAESCNCKRADLQDIHINVVADPKDAGKGPRTMIVEITPREEFLHKQWTLPWAQKNLTHKWVRFTGWMLFDAMHSAESQNTKGKPQQCGDIKVKEIWRATAWEVHPVTDLQVLPGKP